MHVGCVIISLLVNVGLTFGGSIHNTLPYFETLHHNVLRHSITRRDTTSRPHSRVVQFTTHNRRFKLVLERDHSVLPDNFIAFAADNQNNKQRVDVEHEFYRGFEASEPDNSFVRAYWENGKLTSASIQLANDTWCLESSIHHLPLSDNYTMISYRGSDLKISIGDERIQLNVPPESRAANYHEASSSYTSKRSKRSGRSDGVCQPGNQRKSCSLLLVADHRFHKLHGYHKVMSTINYLINQITLINDLFQLSEFGSCGSGFGFHIKQIIVQTEPSTERNFNDNSDSWDTEEFLKSFSSEYRENLAGYCVGHLFTGLAFSNNVGGLAYPGSICSYRGIGINVGWTSYRRKASFETKARTILTQEAMLTTAHEFGHNWGSPHDPDTTECNPSGSDGGKFLMYTYSVSGLDSNNKLFSKCSKKWIGKTLNSTASSCFTEQTIKDKCGNFKLDDGEDCDEGPEISQSVTHRCCSSTTCRFLPHANCSDVHHECCENCVIANTSKICQTEMACHGETFCDGNSKHCPEKKTFKQFGTRCNGGRFCMDGKCESVCKYNNLTSCLCDSVHDSCRWCCKDPAIANSTCSAFFSTDGTWNSSEALPDGTACVQGFCDQGQCLKQEDKDNLMLRLLDILRNLTSGPFAKFMADNIVGSVIVLSLVFWIPLSCLFSCMEKAQAIRCSMEQEEEAQWLAPSNHEVLSKHDQHRWKIVKSTRVRKSQRQRGTRFMKMDGELAENRPDGHGKDVAD